MKKIYRLFFILLLCCGMLLGCQNASPPKYFAYRESDFCAELRGTLGQTPICAKISAKREGNGRWISVEYLADDSTEQQLTLTGMLISAYLDADGSLGGKAEIIYGSVKTQTEANILSGLLSPVMALFSGEDISTVQKNGDIYQLTFSNGSYLALDEAGIPCIISSAAFNFEVVWWEIS